jgi:exopolysaccharide production protein ExoQ
MFFLMSASLFIVFDKKSFAVERIASLTFIPLCMIAIFKVESVTAFSLGLVAIAAMTLVATVWKTASFVQSGRTILSVAAGLSTILLIGIIAGFSQSGPIEAFLNSMNRDTTISGRTEIWDVGISLIKERPLFGLGAEGFWQVGRSDAENLLYAFEKEEGERFSFHNSYIEILVHLGFVGLVFFLIPLTFICYRAVKNWFKHQDTLVTFYILMVILPLARSLTESDLYNVFEIHKELLFLAGLVGIAYQTRIVTTGDKHQRRQRRRAEKKADIF